MRTILPKKEKISWELAPIIIPKRVIVSGRITSTEKLLFGIILNLSENPIGCIATNKYLGMLMCCGISHIQKKIQNLVTHGYITNEYDEPSAIRKLTIVNKYKEIISIEKHEKIMRFYHQEMLKK